jgi:hypothetical protein
MMQSDEPPPFLGTWKRVYTVVLLYVAFVISALYVFTVTTAP